MTRYSDIQNPPSHRWGVILAGGDGKRLLPLTRRITGDDRPKQFCAIMGGGTLLDQTQARVSRMVGPRQTLTIVTETHQRFYADRVAVAHPSLLLVQPHNRGTVSAILYSVLRLRELDPGALVGIFPSDHHFADEEAFGHHIDSAFDAAALQPDFIVLLGIAPNGPDPAYGWIEPGPSLVTGPRSSVFRVNRFWEKPSSALAANLLERGCLWNSFVMVGRVGTFVRLFQQAMPSLLQRFESIRSSFFTAAEREAMLDLYSGIPATNFSELVLSLYPAEFAVQSCTTLGWSDMGEPDRVLSVLRREGINTDSNGAGA